MDRAKHHPLAPPDPKSVYYDDLEDLALWAESSAEHNLGGNGLIHMSGIFMLPNSPFKIAGNAAFDVLNSQFISKTLGVSGTNAHLRMQPNPYDVVTIPMIDSFSLVR